MPQVFDFSFEALDLEDRAVLKDLMFEEVAALRRAGRALLLTARAQICNFHGPSARVDALRTTKPRRSVIGK